MPIRAHQLTVNWFSSSYSNDQGGNCVQGGLCDNGDMAVRDSSGRTAKRSAFSRRHGSPSSST